MNKKTQMVTIYIDGKAYQVEEGDNLLRTCIKLGIDIPYFCYHPALGSVGACRLCAIKRYRDTNDNKGRIVMSCMEPVIDGMIISVNDEEVKNFRAAIIESLMTNHPHDCPICDEGGECHLQDMVIKTGHTYRRFEFKKRTFKNQYLGPYIHHEMNRCIQCYRCVRFYNDYAGGKDFGVTGAHNKLYFGRFEDGPFENIFSGNLVEVCPTGVFTDKTLRTHYTRKWDLTNAPSLCNHCSVGCNIVLGERYGQVRRVLNRYNEAVNGFFICDKGRFEYEYINDTSSRIFEGKINRQPVGYEELKNFLKKISSEGSVKAVGSSQSSIEDNYMLCQWVGKENFFADYYTNDWNVLQAIKNAYEKENVTIFNLKDIEQAEGVLVIGEDVYTNAPRAALSIRQSIRNKPLRVSSSANIPAWHANAVKTIIGNEKGPLYTIFPKQTWLDEIATETFHYDKNETEILCDAIIDALEDKANHQNPYFDKAKNIIKNLLDCRSIAIVSGTGLQSEKIINQSTKIAQLLNQKGIRSGIYCIVPHANSLGISLLTEKTIDTLIQQPVPDHLILLNPVFELTDTFKNWASQCKNVVVLQHNKNEFTDWGNIIVPIATIAESEGTLINAEGRMQRFFSVMPHREGVWPAWKWFNILMNNNENLDNILLKISEQIPLLKQITEVAPGSTYRINGMKVPRQTPRFSGRTSMLAHINVHEPKPAEDKNSPLTFSMEGTRSNPHPTLNAFYLMPGWHSVQATNKLLRELDQVVNARSTGIKIWNR